MKTKMKMKGQTQYMFEGNSELRLKIENGEMTVGISGEIDHHNAPLIREKIDASMEKNRPAVMTVDMSKVSFMDSSGLGLVLGRYKKAAASGCVMKIANPSPQAEKIFGMAGLERIIKIERNCEK